MDFCGGDVRMRSGWRVTHQVISGKDYYQVYRLIDESAVDHSGNREYASGIMYNMQEAQECADSLNLGVRI